MKPQLGTFLRADDAQTNTAGRGEQTWPVEFPLSFVGRVRRGAPTRCVDDPVRDFTVSFTVQFHILAISIGSDCDEGRSVQRRKNWGIWLRGLAAGLW